MDFATSSLHRRSLEPEKFQASINEIYPQKHSNDKIEPEIKLLLIEIVICIGRKYQI